MKLTRKKVIQMENINLENTQSHYAHGRYIHLEEKLLKSFSQRRSIGRKIAEENNGA